MPQTTVRTPDGRTVTVRHPEGATDQEIIDYAKRQAGTAEDDRFNVDPAALLTGITDLPVKGMQFLENLVGGTENQGALEEFAADREARFQDRAGPDADAWRTGGQLLSAGVAGGPTGTTGKLGRDALERVANVATESGLFGALTGGDAAEDAAIGAGIAAPIEALSAGLGKARQVPGWISRLLPQSEEARAADAFAESRGIPVAGEDLIQNNIVRSTGRILDAADPSNFRNKQLAKMQESFQQEIVDPFVKFEDPVAEMGESFQRQYEAVRNKSDELFTQAWRELNPLGNMPTGALRADLMEMVGEYRNRLGPGSKEVKQIEKWLSYGDGTISEWAERRKKLGRDIRKADRSADPDTVDVGVLKDIRKRLDATIDDFGGQSNAYRVANDYFRQNVVPYRETAIGKIIRDGDIERVIEQSMSKAPSAQTRKRMNEVWSSLDESGREAYTQSILQRVMDDATNPETGFSPNVAATRLDQYAERLGENVVGPQMKRAIEGWNNLFRQSGFSAEQVARSRTGSSLAQMGAPVAAVAGMANPLVALPFLPAALVRSRKVRQLLAKMADMKPEHPDYPVLVQEIMSEISRYSGRTQAIAGDE